MYFVWLNRCTLSNILHILHLTLKLKEASLIVAQQETHPSASRPTLITAKSTFTPNGKLI